MRHSGNIDIHMIPSDETSRPRQETLEERLARAPWGEFGVALANDGGFHGLERLLGGNTIEPALKRKLFVVGEIEPNDYADICVGFLFVFAVFAGFPAFCG